MGKLFVIPTPIGNLEDITLRALRLLGESDLILAEDSRQTLKLLNHYSIKKPIRSYHKNNEYKVAEIVAKELEDEGKKYALVSDAGTPGISDAAYLIVNKCIEHNVHVECLPGATAFIPALIESGLPSEKFCFEGFLPHSKGRVKRLRELTEVRQTMIFYESPYRLIKAIEQFSEFFGSDRKASISREITKIYAETKQGTLGSLLEYFRQKGARGEFVVVIEGKNTKSRLKSEKNDESEID